MQKKEKESPEEQRLKKIGLLPGSPVYIGERTHVKPQILLITYSKDFYEEHYIKPEKEEIEKALNKLLKPKPFINWLIFIGVNNVEFVQYIGSYLDLHGLTIEDIVNTHQRPKIEFYESYIYFVGKMLDYKSNDFEHEQVSIIIKGNTLITFHETEDKLIETIKNRIEKNRGSIRRKGVDFLSYSIIDVMTDKYFELLEKLGEEIETFEKETLEKPDMESIIAIQEMKRKIMMIRKILWPLRDAINKFLSIESRIVKKETKLYLKDVHDHIIQITETIEIYRDILSSMVEIHLSSINNKINEIIKGLTIITTIFIPLTFITSVYGMNFKYMPELEHPFGYYAVWLILITIAVIMLLFFKRKKWI